VLSVRRRLTVPTFGIASYGTDSRTVARTSLQFTPETTLITAARDGKARIIAVATGSYTTAELADAGAGTVLADLSAVKASKPPR
jgi:hypothetical protein